MLASALLSLALAAIARAHVAAFANGMYCKGGNVSTIDDSNTDTAVNPLYMLIQEQWWFQHDRGCDVVPPPDGEFLELPAGGSFTVELAHNRAQTTLSYNGQFTSEWPDGNTHPEDWNGGGIGEGCIQNDGAMHVQNETSATGTAFAISYESELSAVTMENLVVFTVLEHTPWKRIATYEVPDLPACSPEGCTCTWLWVPNGCGTPNMYMQGFKCNVTGATSTTPVALAKAPVYCVDDSSQCVEGAKQMIAWHQASGVNVFPPQGISPGYNLGMGWTPGAQSDIFGVTSSPTSSSTSVSPTSTGTSTSAIASLTSQSSAPATDTSSAPPVADPITLSTIPSSLPSSTVSIFTIIPPTTFSTSAIPTAPITTALMTTTTAPSVSPSASAIPISTDPLFPEFVKWMESAWAAWVASKGGSV